MIRRTAAGMAILGFAVACLMGALSGSTLEAALFRALVAMAGFFVVGLGIGLGAELLLREHFSALTKGDDQPAPKSPKPTGAAKP